jgi:hypothetical protein
MWNADAFPRKTQWRGGQHFGKLAQAWGNGGSSGCECGRPTVSGVSLWGHVLRHAPRRLVPVFTLRSLEIAFDGSASIMRTLTPQSVTDRTQQKHRRRLVRRRRRRRRKTSMPVKANQSEPHMQQFTSTPPLWALDWKILELHPGRQPKYTRNKRFVMHWRSRKVLFAAGCPASTCQNGPQPPETAVVCMECV